MNPNVYSRIGKYEYTSIISVRAQQLANNAPTTLETVKAGGNNTAITLAIEEFKAGRLPLKLRRTHIDGTTKVLTLDELTYYH